MKIGFIGVGSMGAAIIPNLVTAGYEISAWNRSASALGKLKAVNPLATPSAAFELDVVVSMLSDDAAVRDVFIDSNALASARPGCIHIVMSTVSPAIVAELETIHAAAGVRYVAAPVFGVPAVAAAAQLNILAAGPSDAIEVVQPIFDVIGKKTWLLGDNPIHACVAKIAGNLMITQAIQAMAEASALTESYGLSAADFLDVVTNTLFACPSYQRYGSNIANRRYEPGFTLKLGLKDVDLACNAARLRGLSLSAAEVVRSSLSEAVERGLGAKDWSALAEAVNGSGLIQR